MSTTDTNYVVRDGQTTSQQQTFGSFGVGNVQIPKHALVDPATGAALAPALDTSIQSLLTQLQTLVAIAQGTDPTPVTQVATGAISVQRTTGIGSTGSGSVVTTKDGTQSNTQSPSDGTIAVMIAPADANGRRSVRNISSVALELMNGPTAYGTGHPLPAGESFTFDASGRTTGAIYCAAASAGGSVSVLTF